LIFQSSCYRTWKLFENFPPVKLKLRLDMMFSNIFPIFLESLYVFVSDPRAHTCYSPLFTFVSYLLHTPRVTWLKDILVRRAQVIREKPREACQTFSSSHLVIILSFKETCENARMIIHEFPQRALYALPPIWKGWELLRNY
jgi:hypothetical protein